MKIIVTGASKGIGKGIAAVLAREGHDVGLMARTEALLNELKDELSQYGGTITAVPADLRNYDSASKAVEKVIQDLGGVDALINNAGIVLIKDVWNISIEEWDDMIATNVNGLFYCTRTVLPHLKKQGRGHIINISSISGRVMLPGGSGYAASKFAVSGFTESIFQEVRDAGIKVTLVYPGSVDSASHRHDPNQDTSWKVPPEDVGIACLNILTASKSTVISQLEIRPINRPPKK